MAILNVVKHIPIREEAKQKTSFWVNDKMFEFSVPVTGLKSSHYH